MARLAFIGLGNMGLPMVRNLLTADQLVTAYDLSAELMKKAEQAGAASASSLSEAVANVDMVISMVPAGPHVKAVYQGPEGIIAKAAANTLLIDCSTIDVATAREVAAEAAEAGFEMVDAPVSGGVGGAEAGTLTFMVGGSKAAFAKAEPILQAMGAKIIHTGGSGNGQAAKICNNMLLAISMIGTAEAFALGRKLGLDDQILFDVSSTSSGRCWSLDTYCPVPGPVPSSPANRNYEGGFAAALMLKDLGLSQSAAGDTGAKTPLGAKAQELYQEFTDSGHGGLDFSGIFKMLDGDI